MDVLDKFPLWLIAGVTIGVIALTSIFAKTFFSKTTTKKKSSLNPLQFKSFQLVKKTAVSHDTRIFRFGLDHADQVLGLPIGQHITVKATIGGEEVTRLYTPITSDDEHGYFELMIKVYFSNVHPKFPNGGKMSQHLESMAVGDAIEVKGPGGKFEYLGRGSYRTKQRDGSFKTSSVKQFAMIAGGTGITPLLQIIRAILKDKSDPTQMSLIFANQTEEDILLRPELEECAKDGRFTLWFTLDRPNEATWKYSKGFICEEMIAAHLPKAGAETVALMCGPGPMITHACKPNFIKVGFTEELMFSF